MENPFNLLSNPGFTGRLFIWQMPPIQRGPGAIMWWVCNDTQSVGRPCPLCWN
jgi:hypothetical protein